VLLFNLPVLAQRPNVEELQKENRLPEWANHVCYVDSRNIQSGWFMVVAYQSAIGDDQDAKEFDAFGYERGVTYQEYIGSDKEIAAINMPISPEEYSSQLRAALETKRVSAKALEMLEAQLQSAQNAIAMAKAVRKKAAKYPTIEEELLKDEEERALLDAPDGTNYHNFITNHPEFPEVFLHRQKYYNAGIPSPPSGAFTVYREGNLLFEKDFGSDVFETAVTGEASSNAGLLVIRVEMQDTASGLRFVKSQSLRNSGVGIPIAGKCDPLLGLSQQVVSVSRAPVQAPPSTSKAKQAPTPAQPSCTNNGTYLNSNGQTVQRPESCSAPPQGATARCRDGVYSFSKTRRGTCSQHGGVANWL